MTTFLLLLLVCLVGGFLVTGIVWVIFWLTGVFTPPPVVRDLLHVLRGTSGRDTEWASAFQPVPAIGVGVDPLRLDKDLNPGAEVSAALLLAGGEGVREAGPVFGGTNSQVGSQLFHT